MTTEEAAPPLHLDESEVGVLELENFEVPYVDLEFQPYIHSRLVVGSTEYKFQRSYPVQGHSAVMPADVAELLGASRRVIVAERHERYHVYVA